MASPKEAVGNVEASVHTFPVADLDEESSPSQTNNFPADPDTTQLETSKMLKECEEAKEKEKEKEKEKNDAAHRIKSAIVVSGVIVAVIGAIFAITKKLREK